MSLLNKKLAYRAGEGVIVGILMGPGKLVTMPFLSCKKQFQALLFIQAPISRRSVLGLFGFRFRLGLVGLGLGGKAKVGSVARLYI